MWRYYCFLHLAHSDNFFDLDSLPDWDMPGVSVSLLTDDGVIMPLQAACSGECLFAYRFMPMRGVANDR